MKQITALLFALLFASAAWAGQTPQVPLNFSQLEEKATHNINITLPKSLLTLAVQFLDDSDPEVAKLKKVVAKLQGIFVRSYEFEKESDFSPRDLDGLRKTITGSGWTCIFSVHNKKGGEDTDVCLRQDGDKVLGLVIVSTEPKRMTVVNIVGSITAEEFGMLQGHIGVPEMDLKPKSKGKDKPNDD